MALSRIGEGLQAQALALVQAALRREASAAQRLAFEAGVSQAEVEMGVKGLFDPEAQAFIEAFEFRGIQTVTARVREEFRFVLREVIAQGKTEREAERMLLDLASRREHLIRTVARTEMNRAANFGRYSAWKKSGRVRGKEFMATRDGRVRPGHLAADGEVVPLGAPFTRGDASGYIMPPIAPNCRCSAGPVTRLGTLIDTGEAFRAQERFKRQNDRERLKRSLGMGRDTATEGCPVHGADAPLALAVAVVGREIPRLLRIERAHEEAMARILRGWPALLLGKRRPALAPIAGVSR